MSLVVLTTAATEPELITQVALLHAFGVRCYVRGGGIAALLPGPQIYGYNAQAIMVPAEDLALAQEILASHPEESADCDPAETLQPKKKAKGLLRMLGELLLFGWFVPPSQHGSPKE